MLTKFTSTVNLLVVGDGQPTRARDAQAKAAERDIDILHEFDVLDYAHAKGVQVDDNSVEKDKSVLRDLLRCKDMSAVQALLRTKGKDPVVILNSLRSLGLSCHTLVSPKTGTVYSSQTSARSRSLDLLYSACSRLLHARDLHVQNQLRHTELAVLDASCLPQPPLPSSSHVAEDDAYDHGTQAFAGPDVCSQGAEGHGSQDHNAGAEGGFEGAARHASGAAGDASEGHSASPAGGGARAAGDESPDHNEAAGVCSPGAAADASPDHDEGAARGFPGAAGDEQNSSPSPFLATSGTLWEAEADLRELEAAFSEAKNRNACGVASDELFERVVAARDRVCRLSNLFPATAPDVGELTLGEVADDEKQANRDEVSPVAAASDDGSEASLGVDEHADGHSKGMTPEHLAVSAFDLTGPLSQAFEMDDSQHDQARAILKFLYSLHSTYLYSSKRKTSLHVRTNSVHRALLDIRARCMQARFVLFARWHAPCTHYIHHPH